MGERPLCRMSILRKTHVTVLNLRIYTEHTWCKSRCSIKRFFVMFFVMFEVMWELSIY